MSEIFEYKCPNCGGALRFDPGAQTVKCPYCDSEISVEYLSEQDKELDNITPEESAEWEKADESTWDETEDGSMNLYVCESCGGEILAQDETIATSCPYCGNPVVFKGNIQGQLKPEFVIPFKLDKKDVKDRYLKHLEKKKFLPKEFKDENKINEWKAVYVPFWLFDCEAKGTVHYDATTVTAWSDRKHDFVKTSHYDVLREGTIAFDNVPVDGSVAIQDDLMQSIEPFDMNEAVDFKTAYLAGYLADRYTLASEDAIKFADARIRQSVKEEFAATVTGFASVTPKSENIGLMSGKAKYALLPVWFLGSTYKGEKYTFAMNGQTGKFVGNLPVNKKAFWKQFLIRGLIFSAVIFALFLALFAF